MEKSKSIRISYFLTTPKAKQNGKTKKTNSLITLKSNEINIPSFTYRIR